MKKFLSLLLALTLVLSLVVVPARADADTVSGAAISPNIVTIKVNETPTLTVNHSNAVLIGDESTPVTFVNATNWSSSDQTVATVSDTGVVSPLKTGTTTISCVAHFTYGESGASTAIQHLTRLVTVEAYDYVSVVKSLTYNGRTYAVTKTNDTTGTAAMCYDKGDTAEAIATAANWGVVKGTKDTATIKSVTGNLASVTVTVTTKPDGASTEQDVTITVTPSALVAPTRIDVSPASPKTQQKVTFTATASPVSKNTQYIWTIKDKDSNAVSGYSKTQSGENANKYELAASNTLAAGTYTMECAVTESTAANATTAFSKQFTITADKNKFVADSYNRTMTPNSKQDLSFQFYSLQDDLETKNEDINLTSTDVKWTASNTGTVKATIDSTASKKSAILTIPSGCTASTVTVTVKFTYDNKEYSYTYSVSLQALSATLSTSVANGSSITLYKNKASGYDSSNLAKVAESVLKSKVASGLTVATASIKNPLTGVTGGTVATTSSSYYTFTAYKGSLTAATMTIEATASDGNTYEIKLTIPVTPIMGTNFETVTAEPVSSTATTTSYRVYFPTTYTHYYVINKTGSTPSSWSNSMLGTAYSSTTPYTLSSSDFNSNGTCTLYVVAKNGISSNYYSGQMVVTQTNYNINYNGVTGETVQFAQSDFNDFMQSVSEARGDASKTKSYPYVTFDYVTFSLPTTAQGTLYYGGTAMSTSNSSGAFNTRTKVTNLDSVTFVPNAKTTAKTITLNFTLYATRYSSSSTSRGTTVSYSGSVVVNLVREDIKYTVSQGDSVRFDESDFLSYLRSTKGYTSNYTIDYVTFDQSAVSAVNEGSLYTYYNGYNYGGSVKTTDRFYYNATASQNALSDVAFLASRYAKTGETVYIPFTIYARYGTTGTGTRQLTGTVAIKIGQTMNFIDVKTTDYFYNSVKWAVGKNITNGTSSTTFSPYKSCTRAEIVTFLWRAAGSPEPTITRNPFRDVNAVTHSSYYKAILWASQKGITSGTSATAFSPDQVCTRAQIVTFLYRYAGKPSGYYSNPFKDVSSVNEASYYNAILWAVGKGITQGTSTTTFSPYASCTRGEAVTFLYRYVNGVK